MLMVDWSARRSWPPILRYISYTSVCRLCGILRSVVETRQASTASSSTAKSTWDFANSSDKQRLEAFLRRCIRLHLYRQCDPTVTRLVEDIEDKLFTSVLHNDQHVLFHLLPDHNNCTYNLRPRRHELVLAIKGDARLY